MFKRKKIPLFLLFVFLGLNLNANSEQMEIRVVKSLNQGLKATENFLEQVPTYYVYEEDKTILHYAVELDKYEIVEFLISKNVELNRQGGVYFQTALQDAIFYEYFRIARLLINSGTQLDIQNIDGETALHIAAKNGYYDMITVLINNGASKDILNLDGQTPYDLIPNFSMSNTKKMQSILKPSPISTNRTRRNDYFPLDSMEYGQATFTLDQMNFDTDKVRNDSSVRSKGIDLNIVNEDTESINSNIGDIIKSK
ncbi:MAG: Inversin protein alternative isoform, putative [uncultured Sulfurovum sp.]|uniref:Inversin protein alternative isoform, putative n=1 Tax=uncultured Sulfurovum sp. TaxID=269237 RepID=A0A6S6S2G7_9BACT|nr:MAG: Inversin protein alternative isoform, putative [uncultured Sulfurovum sp.]